MVPEQAINRGAQKLLSITLSCTTTRWGKFVWSKDYEFYIWLAIDRDTKEIVGCFVGDRTRKPAQRLWDSLPPICRQYAVAYTDFWKAYEQVIPSKLAKG